MPMSDYKRRLREKVGSTLLLTPGALALIFDDRRRLLLQQRPNGRWCLPGGEIDPGESPADALVREVWEEMGVTVEPVRVAGVFGGPAWHVTYDNGDEDTALDLVFESRITSGTITPDGIEVVDTAFFGAEEIAGLDLSRSDRLILAQAFHSGEAAYFAPPTWTPPADGIRHNGISPYLRGLREQLGNAQIMVAGAGAAVVDERGDVLLQRRGDNDRWGLVGGGIDPDESPANAVVREVWEETGLLTEPVRLLGVFGGEAFQFTYPNGDQIALTSVFFLLRITGGVLSADGQESLALEFFPPEEALAIIGQEQMRQRFVRLVEGHPAAYFQPPTWQPPTWQPPHDP